MTNGDFVRQLDDMSLAKALMGDLVNQYCTSSNPRKCDHEWDDELDCSACEACVFRWLKGERRDGH